MGVAIGCDFKSRHKSTIGVGIQRGVCSAKARVWPQRYQKCKNGLGRAVEMVTLEKRKFSNSDAAPWPIISGLSLQALVYNSARICNPSLNSIASRLWALRR